MKPYRVVLLSSIVISMSVVFMLSFSGMFFLSMMPTEKDTRKAQLVIDVNDIKEGTSKQVISTKPYYGSYGNQITIVHRTAKQIHWLKSQNNHIQNDYKYYHKQQQDIDQKLRSTHEKFFVFDILRNKNTWSPSGKTLHPITTYWHNYFYHMGQRNDVLQISKNTTLNGYIYFSHGNNTNTEELLNSKYQYALYDLAGYPSQSTYPVPLSVPQHRYDEKGFLVVGSRYKDSLSYRVNRFLRKNMS